MTEIGFKAKIQRLRGVSRIFTKPLLVVIVLTGLVPIFVTDQYILHVLILCLVYSMLALSYDLLLGGLGIWSFGHIGSFGVGAYVSALISMRLGISPWFSLLVGGIFASGFGLIMGFPCLRRQRSRALEFAYVIIVTMSFSELARAVTANLVDITRGEMGLAGIPPLGDIVIPGLPSIIFGGGARIPYYYVALVMFVATLLVLLTLYKSRFGIIMKSIQGNPDAAESLGVNVSAFKLTVFCATAFLAGIYGGFFAHYIGILQPSKTFGLGLMFDIMIMTLVGGSGSIAGPAIGAFTLTGILELLRGWQEYRFLIYGVLFILITHLARGGIVNEVPKLVKRIYKIVS